MAWKEAWGLVLAWESEGDLLSQLQLWRRSKVAARAGPTCHLGRPFHVGPVGQPLVYHLCLVSCAGAVDRGMPWTGVSGGRLPNMCAPADFSSHSLFQNPQILPRLQIVLLRILSSYCDFSSNLKNNSPRDVACWASLTDDFFYRRENARK